MTQRNTQIGKEGLEDLFVDKNGELHLTKLFRWLMTVEDRVSMSLPSYLKRSVVESRTFITKEAGMEECINDVLYCINVMYAGWCMTALSMNHMVGGSKVRDVLSTVATESKDTSDTYVTTDELFAGLESFSNVQHPLMYNPSGVIPNVPDDGNSDGLGGGAGNKIIEYPKDYRLTSGITIDVSFNVGASSRDKRTISVPLTVRLNPTIITTESAKQFFASNFKPDMWMRWFKVKTGEISFFKDFLFELDLQRERSQAIKNDKTGTLTDMFASKQNALSSYLLKLIGWRADRQNIASSIHVFTKPQFDEYCRATHCNFDSVGNRDKYFKSTMAMMIAVIDNEYQMVDMYFAGVGNKARYQFSQLQNFTKPNQYDLTSVMRAFANTSTPRF